MPARCASCHGADLKGNTQTGAPNLADNVWLYGTGSVVDIERTILYGIRSGHGQSHNVAEMPAFGLSGMLTSGEIGDVVQYILSLNHRANLSQAALSGQTIFAEKGTCGDCHGPDGKGDPYYGLDGQSHHQCLEQWRRPGFAIPFYLLRAAARLSGLVRRDPDGKDPRACGVSSRNFQ